jgi:putative DNA primase/helicase
MVRLRLVRPRIKANNPDLHALTSETWEAIHEVNSPPNLFLREGSLILLNRGVAKPVTNQLLLWYLTNEIYFYKIKTDEETPMRPSNDLLQNLIVVPDSRLPHLRGVTRIPTFAPDGTLHSNPGYSPATQLIFSPLAGLDKLEVPLDPSEVEVRSAVEFILTELLGDFPFADQSSKAHVLAALLLPFVRPMIEGPTPLHMISKPKPGSGAGLIVEIIGSIVCDRPSLQAVPRQESERQRWLLALLMQDPGVVVLDNIQGRLEGAALASCLTSTTYQDREVGSSRILVATNRCLWLATGNNPDLSDEMSRRTVFIRLDAKVEHPELRTGFRQPNVKAWAVDNRPALVRSLLTIVRAWIAGGMTDGAATLGGFESWSQKLGGILGLAGVEGFLKNVEAWHTKSDDESLRIRIFVEHWATTSMILGATAGELLLCAESLDLGPGDTHSRAIRLGKLLGQRTDQVFGRWKIDRKEALTNGKQLWMLRRVGKSSRAPCAVAVDVVEVVDRVPPPVPAPPKQ